LRTRLRSSAAAAIAMDPDARFGAVAKLRLQPVVLINAIASQTPAIGVGRVSRPADRGGQRAKIAAVATGRLRADDRRVVVRHRPGLARPTSW
jgi:hypothetical protein